jgi:hypothetical protein
MFISREPEAALQFVEKFKELLEKQGKQIKPAFYYGYVYLKNGQKEKSKYHFEGDIWTQRKIIEQNQPLSLCHAYIRLACIYSAMADKVKAVEFLRKAVKCKEEDVVVSPSLIIEFKNHPMFDIIRDEPEFQELIKIAEDKWLPEKKKIERLLQEYWSTE